MWSILLTNIDFLFNNRKIIILNISFFAANCLLYALARNNRGTNLIINKHVSL